LQDWEIMNTPAKGSYPTASSKYPERTPRPFFALYAKPTGGKAVTRCLEGVLPEEAYEGWTGSRAVNHGLPRFEQCSFAAAYPFGQVLLRDPAVPVEVRLEAFNPLIPADADRSGIPAAILRYVLTNRTNQRVKAGVCGYLTNPVGKDTEWNNRCCFRRGQNIAGVFMDSVDVPEMHPTWGTLALTTTARSGITCQVLGNDGPPTPWGNEILSFWDDFSQDGKLEECHEARKESRAFLSVQVAIPPKGVKEIRFLLTWRFPNRITWTPKPKAEGSCCGGKSLPDPEDIIGNYYCTQYRDAWDIAEKTVPNLKVLERDTLSFVRAFCEADIPLPIKDAALSNLSTLRTQTCFRTPDGQFFGWEGCCDGSGCCLGNCTHVWNYEQATAFLFGDLAMKMRDVEFTHATHENGKMSFRVKLPLERAKEWSTAAADGQMGCLIKIYRDWQLSGDDETLKRLWPNVRKAMEFCWIPLGWDADQDGVMEGCQHNTMDVEYFGPNPQMTGWYLGALRAVEEMARYLGETDFAGRCRALFESGSKWMDEYLFNGEYYEHHIQPPASEKEIAEGLKMHAGARDVTKPDYQLGAGCLVDQLVGQYVAHVCGLGYLHDKRKIRKTLQSILKYNRCDNFDAHFNCLRSYAMGRERALLMAAYPNDRPAKPFPYFTEVMTGFEYTAAIGMIQEGMEKQGLEVIADIRDRYDGRKRSPFNEAECGHHYARAMASWAAVVALTGFHYSGVTQTMEFAAREGKHFWSNGYAWGACRIHKVKKAYQAELTVLHGELKLRRFILKGARERTFSSILRLRAGQTKKICLADICSATS
jgi:non-lysosomal glucosylceramidase